MSVIEKIKEAIEKGKLAEPFGKKDLEEVVPDLGRGTYNAYLWKHHVGNPGGKKEYFEKVAPGKFRLKK